VEAKYQSKNIKFLIVLALFFKNLRQNSLKITTVRSVFLTVKT